MSSQFQIKHLACLLRSPSDQCATQHFTTPMDPSFACSWSASHTSVAETLTGQSRPGVCLDPMFAWVTGCLPRPWFCPDILRLKKCTSAKLKLALIPELGACLFRPAGCTWQCTGGRYRSTGCSRQKLHESEDGCLNHPALPRSNTTHQRPLCLTHDMPLLTVFPTRRARCQMHERAAESRELRWQPATTPHRLWHLRRLFPACAGCAHVPHRALPCPGHRRPQH